MSTPVTTNGKAPAWGEEPQASGLGSGASPSRSAAAQPVPQFVLRRDADHRVILYPELRFYEARRALEEWAAPLREDFELNFEILADDTGTIFDADFERWAEERGIDLDFVPNIPHAVKLYAAERTTAGRSASIAVVELHAGGRAVFTVYALVVSIWRKLRG